MPIIHIEEIKPPCKPYPVVPSVLLGEREVLALNNTRFMTSPSEFTNFHSNFQLFKFSHLLEVVVIRRRKIAGTDPDTGLGKRLLLPLTCLPPPPPPQYINSAASLGEMANNQAQVRDFSCYSPVP